MKHFLYYIQLVKPRILFANGFTATAGFFLNTKASVDYQLLFWTVLGLSFIIASACTINNILDRTVDQKMKRTQMRVLATGVISIRNATIFAFVIGIVGNLILFTQVNLLSLIISDAGFLIYILYTFCKTKTMYATEIGSFAGATPPLIGSCAVSMDLNISSWIFFLILICWQMPHFLAIAIEREEEYQSAGIPVLPAKKGLKRTYIHMMVYIAAVMMGFFLLWRTASISFSSWIVIEIVSLSWFLIAWKSKRVTFLMKYLSLATLFLTCFFIFLDGFR